MTSRLSSIQLDPAGCLVQAVLFVIPSCRKSRRRRSMPQGHFRSIRSGFIQRPDPPVLSIISAAVSDLVTGPIPWPRGFQASQLDRYHEAIMELS